MLLPFTLDDVQRAAIQWTKQRCKQYINRENGALNRNGTGIEQEECGSKNREIKM